MPSRERRTARVILLLLLFAILLSSWPSPPDPAFAAAEAARVPAADPSTADAPSPTPRATQGTFPAVADAFIESRNPDRNYGGSDQIGVGVGTGVIYRGALRFNLSAIPRQATILDATLRGYVLDGPAGQVLDVHRVRTPWTEGTGSQFAYRQPIVLRETAGVSRLREPVDIRYVLPVNLTTTTLADFRVYDDAGREVPSQIYGDTYWGSAITELHVVFGATVPAMQTATYSLQFGNSLAVVPPYRTVTPWNQLWSYPNGSNYASPTAADLDLDGRMEIVFGSTTGWIYALRADGSELWKYLATAPVDYVLTVADVVGDAHPEVLYAVNGPSDVRLYALTWDGQYLWDSGLYPTNAILSPIALSDTDRDGIKEIYVGSQDKELYSFFANNGTFRWSIGIAAGSDWGYGAAVGNVRGGPGPEITYTTTGGNFYIVNPNGTTAAIYSPTTQTTVVTPSLADFTGDGYLDIVAGDQGNNGNQFAFRGTDGIVVWNHQSLSNQFGGQILVDFEDDGLTETLFALTRRNSVRAIDSTSPNPNTLWTSGVSGAVYAVPAAADVTLDGVEDVLIGSWAGNLYVFDPTTSGGLIRSFPTTTGVTATPAVADLDGDGTMEIVFSSRDRTYAYSTASLGHDFRMTGYNYNMTGRFLDGNSPDGAPLLLPTLPAHESLSGTGVTWRTTDGTTLWAAPGADYDATRAALALSPGTGAWASWNVTSLVQSWTSLAQPNVGLVIKASDESVPGITTLASREGNATFVPVLDVLYNENLEPSIRGTVPNQIYPEDTYSWSLDLTSYSQDPDTPIQLRRWDLAGVNRSLFEYQGGNITGNHTLTFYPQPNAYGSNVVTLIIFDEGNRYDAQPLWVNITPVNDAPVFGPFAPTTMHVRRGAPYYFDFGPHIFDIDNLDSELRLVTNSPHVTGFTGNLTVRFNYPANYAEPWDFVIFTVDDGQLQARHSAAIGVSDDTPPVLIRSLEDVTLWEGELRTGVFDLDDYFLDPDNDALFYSYGASHVEAIIQANHSVDIRALGNWFGAESLTFRAEDPQGAIAEDTILVTVQPVNDPPSIAYLPPFVVHYNETYRFDLAPHITDPDNALSEIRISTDKPAYVTVNGTVLEMLFPFSIPPFLTTPYVLPLVIVANDTVDEGRLITSVSVTDDHPPVLVIPIPDQSFLEDVPRVGAFNLDTYFVDVDPGSTIFYTSGQVNLEVTIRTDHSVDFQSQVPDWYGIEQVTFRARDERGAYSEDTIKVTVRPVNDAPRFTEIPVIVSRDHSFFFNLFDYVWDVEGDALRAWTTHPYVQTQGLLVIFDYPDSVREDLVNVSILDFELATYLTLSVQIVGPDLFSTLLPWLLALAGAGVVIVMTRALRSTTEHVFLIYGGGIPLVHLSRTLTADKDPDLVASMFTAIQAFMNESFHSLGVGELKSIELADHRVALAKGQYVTLLVLYRGRASGRIDRRAQEVVREVEKRFKGVLVDWNGDMDRISDVKLLLERLYGAKETGGFMRGLSPLEAPKGPGPGPANGRT